MNARPQPDSPAVIREYDARLRAVFEAAVDAIFTIDERGIIQSLNRSAVEMFGYAEEEIIGKNISLLMASPHDHQHDGYLARYLKTGEKHIIGIGREVTARRKDGVLLPVELAVGEGEPGSRHRFTGFIRDISKRKELEGRFLRAQRLESIGTLVSGIAHDLNNVLTPVLMAVKLLKKDRPGLDRTDLLETAQTSAERGVNMIRQLLTFVGGVSGEKASITLKPIVQEVIGLLEHTFPKSISIQYNIANTPLSVLGDATQISQVLLNLCVNARDAMPDGGTLTLTLSQNHLHAHTVQLYPGAREGDYAVITVSDTGTGIPKDVQEKIFDPFFTTKPIGQGTGLGLSTVLGIVKSHGGFINLYSEPNRGTKMCVFLPTETLASSSTADIPASSLQSANGETILVVDDEKAILSMVKSSLQSHGYQVIIAEGGRAALDQFRASRDRIRVVILDMMMPGMDGPAVMSEIRKESADVPIIAASGLRPSGHYATAIADAHARFLSKPYSDDDLIATISHLLHPTPNSPSRS